ncbi:polyprenyl synthetase family protein [Nocardioides bruguierae]|uniref:polyprenyl synthetase family protein n=1 Tax=Nocardioides bruguierae TaxID=2945102 RepID=UPI002021804F|nr:polyprenyl synthetase family protein [Nocardioides bruguierae]MCL8027597.1 polyprenyl synthetase family protein [Nocardioides bruguierae]
MRPAAAVLADVEDLLRLRLERLQAEWHHGEADGTTDPVLGDADLPGLLESLVLGGGKRFRPLLCHWGWVAAGGPQRGEDPSVPVRLGAALELLHAFGLAQDDVMDGSETRRGAPAVHVTARTHHADAGGRDDSQRYGESVATLVGDLAHAEADAIVAELPQAVRHLWWRTSLELVRGQAHDLSEAAAGGGPDAEARAWEVARAKSGGYTVQRPLELGATAAGADAGVLRALGTYGRHLGEAFALRDDLLGVWGDPAVTGKPAHDDLRSGKATVLLARAEAHARAQQDEAAQRVLTRVRAQQHEPGDVEAAAAAMDRLGVRAGAEEQVRASHAAALAAVEGCEHLDAAGVQGLRWAADAVAWRQK